MDSAEWRQLRALARHLDDLQTDLQRQRNRLHARQLTAEPVAAVEDNWIIQSLACLATDMLWNSPRFGDAETQLLF
ncbi:MAG: hypothetical protein JNJ61_26120 [Anaerolineae bacterium]|nr:hypothetical protein [Anaerolineae bacterium]